MSQPVLSVIALLQDLNNLLSAFSAQPWRHGCTHLFAFIFRTRAAAAYTNSIMRPCNPSSTMMAAASVKAVPASVKAVPAKQAFDSRGVADGDRKAGLYGDDSELTGSGEGCVVVVVTPAGTVASEQAVEFIV